MSTLIGIDIGGTFTDVVALDAQSGAVTVTKVPSTPSEYSDGFFHGLEKIQRMADIDPHDILRLVHGTTVATNAILEKKGSRIGILTTKGFRDVLIIGRGTRSILYNVNFDSETPDFLCPRELIREVGERVNAQGEIQESLNEEDVLREVDFLVKEQGVTSIAVCYLFSFFNAANEERTYEIIKERYPEVRVSLSCRINPRFREYERTVVTAFDAYIGPVMDSYLSKLENRLEETTGERVRLTRATVEVFYVGNRICSHPRLYGRFNQYATIQEHMPPEHQKYVQWNGERFMHWAGKVGSNTQVVVHAILSSYKVEQQGYKSCMGLLKLADKYTPERLENACKRALEYTPRPSLKNIQAILASGQDKAVSEQSAATTFSSQYGFTRGAEYYGRGNK